MSVKKRAKLQRIEPSTDGSAIVVHFTNEITHLDEEGLPVRVEKSPDKREVSVAKAIRGLKAQSDIAALAQEIVEKCKYIPDSKTRQVEQILAKMHSTQPPLSANALQPPTAQLTMSGAFLDKPPSRGGMRGGTHDRSSSRRGRGGDGGGGREASMSLSCERWSPGPDGVVGGDPLMWLADVLPEASFPQVDDYAEDLYEEQMEAKTLGAQRLLRLSLEVRLLRGLSDHSTLLGVLSRELRENAKRSHELAVAITGIFLCLSHYSQFHSNLVRHQCNDVTLRVVEYETKRSKVLQKELELSKGRMIAKGSQASESERQALAKEERRYSLVLNRQDHLLQLCLMVLRDLSEDVTVEKKLASQKICHLLAPLLSRGSKDLLVVTLGFLLKLVAFEVNKDQLVKEPEALSRLAELCAHNSVNVALLALRVCYNLSFDPRARSTLVTHSGFLATLVVAARQPPVQKVASRLLYHLSMDGSTRSLIAEKHPDCLLLALQCVVNCPDTPVDRDAAALCVNLAAHEACASSMVELDLFPRLAARAVGNADAVLLKVMRHVASFSSVRPRLLEVMRGDSRSAEWLLQLVRIAVDSADRAELLVEALGTLASLEFKSPDVPWAELCEAGLLDLLHRLLVAGFSDDDVVLECVMLTGLVALDSECGPLLASSKVLTVLPDLLMEKQEDSDITLQLLFTFRCLLLQEDTCEVLLQETDVPDRIMEMLREECANGGAVGAGGGGGQHAAAMSASATATQALQLSGEEVLDLILAVEPSRGATGSRGSRRSGERNPVSWTDRIKAFRFEMHNREWCQVRHGQDGEPRRVSEHSDKEQRSNLHWADASHLTDRYWGSTAFSYHTTNGSTHSRDARRESPARSISRNSLN